MASPSIETIQAIEAVDLNDNIPEPGTSMHGADALPTTTSQSDKALASTTTTIADNNTPQEKPQVTDISTLPPPHPTNNNTSQSAHTSKPDIPSTTIQHDNTDHIEEHDDSSEGDIIQRVVPIDTTPGDAEKAPRSFQTGFASDRNHRYRRTMEDTHTIIEDFNDIEEQAFFAIYDGHAGKSVAEYCEKYLHTKFAQLVNKNNSQPIPQVFDSTFTDIDSDLDAKTFGNAGCTVIAAFIRSETRDGITINPSSDPSTEPLMRKLYTANVGDARAVLSRGGQALRLSYDHKASDEQEVQRITSIGGFVFSSRVNGVLAVTRSIGDVPMKDFIAAHPYTTETLLTDKDDLLILACDGVWDVMSDQDAVDLIRHIDDPQEAADTLLRISLDKCSTDNLSIIIVRLRG